MTFSLGPRAASAGYRLAAFDQIGSTNAEAMSRARDGERGPMWFVTSEQAAGLALEAALRRVSIEASLRAAGSDHMKFSLKWPNDVLAGQQKLAGILLEAEAVADNQLAVVVGIGTNVIAAPEGTPTPATSWAALGVNIGAEELFAVLSDSWAEFRGIWDH